MLDNLGFNFSAKEESDATEKLMSHLRWIKNSWWYKIPDIWKKTKPLDIIWNLSWEFVCIEVKYIRLKKTPEDLYKTICSWLEVHQIASLESNARAWWQSYIAWYIKSLSKLIIYKWMSY